MEMIMNDMLLTNNTVIPLVEQKAKQKVRKRKRFIVCIKKPENKTVSSNSIKQSITIEKSQIDRQGRKSVFRNDAYLKVTGRAKYVDDLKTDQMAHCVPVYSDYVHARIDIIDTRTCENAKGVIRVITAKDIPGASTYGQINQDYHMLADDKIRFNGDVVALVVAESRELAKSAAGLIKIEATELPAIFNPEEALAAEPIHDNMKSNLVNHYKIRNGNTESAFEYSDYVVEETFNTTFVEHAYLETEGALCIPKPDGKMIVYGSMQHPFNTRKWVAAILGVKLSQVEIIGCSMGGGFGGKDDTAAIVCARTALAAKLIKRPVKMIYDREWSMRESYKRCPYKLQYKIGLSKVGHILAVQCKFIVDSGAYTSTVPWLTFRSIVHCCGPYKIANLKADIYSFATNNVFTGAFRGFGSPQINFAIEQMIDICAEKAGIDCIEFRRLNMLRQNSETITGQILRRHKVSIGEVLDKVVKTIGFKNKFKKCSFGKDQDEQYGIGLAMSYRGISLGAEGSDFCSCIINGQFDGSIILETGIHENGQGAESAMILVLAECLGVNKARIRYAIPSTSHIPDGGPTVASRGTLVGSAAVTLAVKNLKRIMSKVLSDKLDCKPREVRFKNDHLFGKTDDIYISWDEAVKLMHQKHKYPFAFGHFKAPKIHWDEKTGMGDPYFTYNYNCQAVELTVNSKTGEIRLINIVAAHDIGKIVNHGMLEGQIYGGIAQGIGMTLTEEIIIKDGRIQNLNFNKYKVPKAVNIPEINPIIVENRDPDSPFGAKGIGESALEIIAPAIANAVYNATGKRYFSLPIKIQKTK